MRTLRNQSSPNHSLKTSEIAEIIGQPSRTVRHRLRVLEKRGEIIPLLRRIDKEPGYVSSTRYREWEDQKYEVRKAHSNELKPVLQEWMQQLPWVTWDEKGHGHIIHETRIVGESYSGKKLPVELNYLFADLEHHMGPTVFEHWNRMKDLARKVSETNLDKKEIARILQKFETFRGKVLQGLRRAYATPALPGFCKYLDD